MNRIQKKAMQMLPSWQIKQPFGMWEPEKCRHILAQDCVDFPKNGIRLAAAKAFALLAHQKCATSDKELLAAAVSGNEFLPIVWANVLEEVCWKS